MAKFSAHNHSNLLVHTGSGVCANVYAVYQELSNKGFKLRQVYLYMIPK